MPQATTWFDDVMNDPGFHAIPQDQGGGGYVDLGNGVRATYLPPPPAPAATPTASTRSYAGPTTGPATNAPEAGGITGNTAPSAPSTTTPASAAQPGAYRNSLQGFDASKLAAGKNDPKYNFAAIAQDYAPTPDGFQQLIQDPRFSAAGFKAVGKDSIQIPDGSVIDVGLSFGSGGGKGWWWGAPDASQSGPVSTSASTAPGSGVPTISAAAAPASSSVLTTSQFAPFQYQNFTYGPFQAPTPESVKNDPGYKFGFDQGLGALAASQAARGILKSGGAAKGLVQFGNDYATTKFDDAYNRALQGYTTNFGTAYQTNQANNAGGLGAFTANTNAALGFGNLANAVTSTANQFALGEGNLALGNKTADQNFILGQGNLGLGYYNAANNFTLGQGQLGLGYYNATNSNALRWANYGLNANQQQFYQNYAFPISTGLSAAGSLGSLGASYGANAGGLITGAGNATAAGQVGSANAWNNAFGTIGSYGAYALPYGMYYGSRGTDTGTPGGAGTLYSGAPSAGLGSFG